MYEVPCVIGAKSLIGSYGTFLYSTGLTVNGPLLPISKVWPSGAAFATISVPMPPFAPGRLSTITDCPSASVSFWAMVRVKISPAPPATEGQMTYGSTGIGGGNHLAGELFNLMTGTQSVHVPYTGSAAALAAHRLSRRTLLGVRGDRAVRVRHVFARVRSRGGGRLTKPSDTISGVRHE